MIDADMAQAAALAGRGYFLDLPRLVVRLEAAARADVELWQGGQRHGVHGRLPHMGEWA